VTPQDYDYIRKLLKERSGLVLGADKQYLVESRLMPVARKAGLASLNELSAALRTRPASPLATTVVEAMTTNESFFFRDKVPFEHFQSLVMPAMARARDKRMRIWCSAASTGQEPYSLAMSIKEMGDAFSGWRIEIIATDISTDALEKAKCGLYSQFEVQRGLPIQMLVKYFSQVGDLWQIAPAIRSMVTYRHFNLLQDFGQLGIFDLVFCRNVLIYFDQPTKTAVLNRLVRSLARDGYLMLGAAETVVGLTDQFRPLPDYRGVYVPAEPASVCATRTAKVPAAAQ
jgi:chemotaxis protein methyltransferase CheR